MKTKKLYVVTTYNCYNDELYTKVYKYSKSARKYARKQQQAFVGIYEVVPSKIPIYSRYDLIDGYRKI